MIILKNSTNKVSTLNLQKFIIKIRINDKIRIKISTNKVSILNLQKVGRMYNISHLTMHSELSMTNIVHAFYFLQVQSLHIYFRFQHIYTFKLLGYFF